MNNHELNCKGRMNVEAELLRRGAASVTPISRGRKRYLLATKLSHSRTVELWVKTKQKGNWHQKIDEAQPTDEIAVTEAAQRLFWVFVDFGGVTRYWIVPDSWIRNDIREAHKKYLQKHGGHRPKNDNSNHHAIDESRLKDWQNKWEILEIF